MGIDRAFHKIVLLFTCALISGWQSFARAQVAEQWPFYASTNAAYHVRILNDGTTALEQRLRMIDRARTKIDLMPYTLEDNATGHLLLHKLMEKALQGVRVRVFIDFWNENGHPDVSDETYAAIKQTLAQRAGPDGLKGSFEIRYYNRGTPFLHPLKMNHRLHAKMMNIDDREIVVGGRNYGDQYFNYDKGLNFLDRDAWVLIPPNAPPANLGAQVSEIFDRYWNCALSSEAKPLPSGRKISEHTRRSIAPEAEDLAKENALRQRIADATSQVMGQLRDEYQGTPQMPTFRTNRIGMVIDQPGWDEEARMVTPVFNAELSKASRYLLMENYAIASTDKHHEMILNIANNLHVPVIVLTNSYAANRAQVVSHLNRAAELSFEKESSNIWLYEVTGRSAPGTLQVNTPDRHLGKYEVHSKSAVIYNETSATSLVGSYNFDGRSDIYNNEASLIFYDNPYIADEIARSIFSRISVGHELMVDENLKLRYVDGSKMPSSKVTLLEDFFKFIGLGKTFRNLF